MPRVLILKLQMMTNASLRALIGWIEIISGDDANAQLQLRVGEIFLSQSCFEF
jgi:hypothetical protein